MAKVQQTNRKKHIIQLFTKKNIIIIIIVKSDLVRCNADNHDSFFITYSTTEKTFKSTMNLILFPNVTKNKYVILLNEE